MATLIKAILGPRLYRIHRPQESPQYGKPYEPNIVEKQSNNIIRYISYFWSFSVYTSPVIVAVLYRKGYFCLEGMFSLVRLFGMIGVFLISAIFFRGLGRYNSPEYLEFLFALDAARRIEKNGDLIRRYDFDFRAWPVDFKWNDGEGDNSKPRSYLDSPLKRPRGSLERVKGLPCQIASYIVAHTFGRRMVYPGSVGLLNAVVGASLMQGRAKLVEEYDGIRAKILTRENNEIDTIFINRKNNEKYPNGNILVICCEGNAGFYEIGCTVTPLEGGYSVLGWNHPGFAGSTGVPLPDQETNAIDAVMQYAIHHLEFLPENIILFAWSIGGFTASWAAMNYPDIKGLILDATFDDIVSLAVVRMPESWKPLVVLTIKAYMNLNNAEQLTRFPGPVLLIRRTKDEMITTENPTVIASNRGNNLLVKLLQHRYPKLLDENTGEVLREWLSGDRSQQLPLWSHYEVNEDFCISTFQSYIENQGSSFPMNIGDDLPLEVKIQLVLFLASKYQYDFDSTHCTPLPPALFNMPWFLDTAKPMDS